MHGTNRSALEMGNDENTNEGWTGAFSPARRVALHPAVDAKLYVHLWYIGGGGPNRPVHTFSDS